MFVCVLNAETLAEVTRLREENQSLEDNVTKLRVENDQLRRRRVSSVAVSSSSILEATAMMKKKGLTRQATIDGGTIVTFREVSH